MERSRSHVGRGWSGEGNARWLALALGCGGLLAVAGCGAAELDGGEDAQGFAQERAALNGKNGLGLNGITTNGITTNGITTNGITTNGLSPGVGSNGLGVNGLSPQGVATPAFQQWFNGSPSGYADMVMKYLVGCALPAGSHLVFHNPSDARVYTWNGNLGLAPDWTAGTPINEAEQQLITACLAAHVNKYGVHVTFSVLGRDERGVPLALADDELTSFSEHEAGFYGNLFTGEGVFNCNDRPVNPAHSSLRACGFTVSGWNNPECDPMVHVGACHDVCLGDPSKPFYETCYNNAKPYRALTTRLRPQDVFTCGDGVCQATESCGTGGTAASCAADCGPCGSHQDRDHSHAHHP